MKWCVYETAQIYVGRSHRAGKYAGDQAGFPSLIGALSTEREDKYDLVRLLHSYGADIQQRGYNGYTPLHSAAARNDDRAVRLLLEKGADPLARTLVDDMNTPLEEAELLNCRSAAEVLRGAE